ncbi:hypothetical protein [Pseudoalteromonas nigrifaciens]|uniref:hypothetical protein n=1 Tax=Pseudoalteromonas nigrifaciens TaxID=28109 RepID=UPI003FCFF4C5
MANIIIKSQYTLSIWNMKLVNKDRDNIHSCGEYTSTALKSVVKYNDADFNKRTADKLRKLNAKIIENNDIIEALTESTGLSKDELLNLAKENSKQPWPVSVDVKVPTCPHNLLFIKSFMAFDEQSLIIDSMIRTGVLLSPEVKKLRKRLIKPIRAFMQTINLEIKEVALKSGA